MPLQHRHPLLLVALAMLVCAYEPTPVPVQGPGIDTTEPVTNPLWQLPGSGQGQAAPGNRAPRVPLFRIAPAFLKEPLGLYEADEVPGGKTSKVEPEPAAADDGPGWVQVAMGADNPYLDFRRPGDPGGLGFYRIYTQVQLFETARSACALCVQTVTPSGIQYWGLPDGATVCSPSLSLYQALDKGLALQGFIGKNVVVSEAAIAHGLQHRLQCGLGVQQMLTSDGLFFSLEGLAQTPANHYALEIPPALQVLPGMHWQLDESCRLSGGLLMPVGSQHHRPDQWQMTCSFQF